MNVKKDRIEDFEIIDLGRNKYKVIFTSPTTGKIWEQITEEHDLIQKVKQGKALATNLAKLKFICKL
jgi:hypothetical protein